LTITLKDRELHSSNEIEEAITKFWDELTSDETQSVFHNWMSVVYLQMKGMALDAIHDVLYARLGRTLWHTRR
jgi:hypothetical protein